MTVPSHHPPGISEVLDVKNITEAAMGFDPTFSPHFYVFQLVHVEIKGEHDVEVVEIYSSETNKWVLKESGWKPHWAFFCGRYSTFFNGSLHFPTAFDKVASVDTGGQSWRVTVVRPGEDDNYDHVFGLLVGHSQGRLLYMDADCWKNVFSIFVLEDYGRDEWTFRQSISMMDLFGPPNSPRGTDYRVASFHPDGDLVFIYDGSRERLLSYDMNRREVHVICDPGEVSWPTWFLPYVPLYSKALVSPNVD